MTQPPPYRLQDSLGYHLSIAARLQERRLDEHLRTLGLTRTIWCILLAVGNEGLSQPSDIAGFVGIDRTATSRALRQMEAQGLLARKRGTDDRRTRRVELTGTGRDRVSPRHAVRARQRAQLSAALTAAEEAELKRLLAKLRAAGEDEATPLKTL